MNGPRFLRINPCTILVALNVLPQRNKHANAALLVMLYLQADIGLYPTGNITVEQGLLCVYSQNNTLAPTEVQACVANRYAS